MSEDCTKCGVKEYCIDDVIINLRYLAGLSSTDEVDASVENRAADALENAKKQIESDRRIMECQARRIESLYARVKELEAER